MLKDFVDNKRVKLNAVLGFYPANAVGDDIEVYEDDSRSVVKAKLFGLRQQVNCFLAVFHRVDFISGRCRWLNAKRIADLISIFLAFRLRRTMMRLTPA